LSEVSVEKNEIEEIDPPLVRWLDEDESKASFV
jgi:hypothetical protein